MGKRGTEGKSPGGNSTPSQPHVALPGTATRSSTFNGRIPSYCGPFAMQVGQDGAYSPLLLNSGQVLAPAPVQPRRPCVEHFDARLVLGLVLPGQFLPFPLPGCVPRACGLVLIVGFGWFCPRHRQCRLPYLVRYVAHLGKPGCVSSCCW